MKSRKSLFSLTISGVLGLAAFTASFSATSQARAEGSFGADGAFVLPLGDFGDVAGIGLGALADLKYTLPSNPNLQITGRIGYIHFLEKHDFHFWAVPVLPGVKYSFNAPSDGPYAGAELGLTVFGISGERAVLNPMTGAVTKVDVSDSDNNLSLNLFGGYESGPLDFRGGLYIVDLGEAGDSMALMASVGYAFAQF